jgi:hypothetical protein
VEEIQDHHHNLQLKYSQVAEVELELQVVVVLFHQVHLVQVEQELQHQFQEVQQLMLEVVVVKEVQYLEQGEQAVEEQEI